jgi:hypothetical protein
MDKSRDKHISIFVVFKLHPGRGGTFLDHQSSGHHTLERVCELLLTDQLYGGPGAGPDIACDLFT